MLTILYWHTIYPRMLKGLKQRFPTGGDAFYRRDWSLACVGVMLIVVDLILVIVVDLILEGATIFDLLSRVFA